MSGRLLTLLATLAGTLVLLPVLAVLSGFLVAEPAVWQHLREYVLPYVLPNTLWLWLGVVLGSLLLGASLAWATVAWDYPGRRWLSFALMLPLAMPTYILAFVYLGWTEYGAWLPTLWREAGWGAFPLSRGRMLTILCMVMGYYPYVYLIARQAFLTQGQRLQEVARSLGAGRWRVWWRVSLPLALPWLLGGSMLVSMETLADYGTVAIFNYDTLTTAIYKTWFGLFSKAGAMQLATVLLLLVALLLLTEYLLLRRLRFDLGGRSSQHFQPRALRGAMRYLMPCLLGLVLLPVFILPLAQLIGWSWDQVRAEWDEAYWALTWNAVRLSLMAAALVTLMAAALVLAGRRYASVDFKLWSRMATLGYALPGAVLAVGFYWPFTMLDQWLLTSARALGLHTDAVLRGTLLALLLAYAARFMAVAYKPVEGASQRLTRSVEEAARLLGMRGWRLLYRLYAPLLAGGMGTAMMLVFIDVMKEIPITLLMRPFGWDTLATKIFEYTSEGQWTLAALPSLTLVLAGLLPVGLLFRTLNRMSSSSPPPGP
ncbi:ABC transporter permease [Leeia sp.]|uniref:ABC transporter permease n=1 Tax=Leeia sp. TaxID=2884678 RepID=UPI0035B360AA